MTEDRPYRASLGLPQAVVIKSAPLPPKQRVSLAQEEADSLDSPSRFQDYTRWKEWNINAAKHGPERMTGPPVFLPSQQLYDELGRSVQEGFGVEVDEGRRREIETGGRVSDWYLALSRGGNPGAGPSNEPAADTAGPELPKTSKTETRRSLPELSQPTTLVKLEARPARHTSQPIRVHSRDWFIRRSLLCLDPPSRTAKPREATSISSLLNIAPSQPRIPPAHYVLGPENKGYELLRDRLGWEGGGLGRPQGWTVEDLDRRKVKEIKVTFEEEEPERDVNGNPIVDLTGDSDSESELSDEPISHAGPGRTAPIATALKLDRLGIGHRRARPKGGTEVAKKVTHTAEEIGQAQRRAKYRVKGVDLGKKGKVRWKERDKRERDDRKRLAAALNA